MLDPGIIVLLALLLAAVLGDLAAHTRARRNIAGAASQSEKQVARLLVGLEEHVTKEVGARTTEIRVALAAAEERTAERHDEVMTLLTRKAAPRKAAAKPPAKAVLTVAPDPAPESTTTARRSPARRATRKS